MRRDGADRHVVCRLRQRYVDWSDARRPDAGGNERTGRRAHGQLQSNRDRNFRAHAEFCAHGDLRTHTRGNGDAECDAGSAAGWRHLERFDLSRRHRARCRADLLE